MSDRPSARPFARVDDAAWLVPGGGSIDGFLNVQGAQIRAPFRFEGLASPKPLDEMPQRRMDAITSEPALRMDVGVLPRGRAKRLHQNPAFVVEPERTAVAFEKKLPEGVARILAQRRIEPVRVPHAVGAA